MLGAWGFHGWQVSPILALLLRYLRLNRAAFPGFEMFHWLQVLQFLFLAFRLQVPIFLVSEVIRSM